MVYKSIRALNGTSMRALTLTATVAALILHTSTQPGAPPYYYCAPTQRYDVAQFPPRCIDCPRIVPNQMPLARIPVQLRIRRTTQKFSPGLPQNSTCGCWRAPANLSVSLALNASWVVSGLVFGSARGRWLREIGVQASDDNVTFIDWGNYTSQNFTDAALTLFAYPIRARFFRVTVLRYANHHINLTSGFPLTAQALVSGVQPFTCDCPMRSSGECCPYMNMTVRKDACVWCMDPTRISTVMVNGCGRCRAGTFEYQGSCYYQRPTSAGNGLQVANPRSNGIYWTVELNLTADSQTLVSLYLTNSTNSSHASSDRRPILSAWNHSSNSHAPFMPLDPPEIASQYLQFDRGRYALNMTEQTIREWAQCPQSTACKGSVVARFVTLFGNGTVWRADELQQPLKFALGVPNLVLSGAGTPALDLARMELHYYSPTNAWMARLIGVVQASAQVYVQWDDQPPAQSALDPATGYIPVSPPPAGWASLTVRDALNATSVRIQQPVSPVTHGALDAVQYTGILVSIRYGLGFDATQTPGDSEQIVFVTARSPQPIRLKRLAVAVRSDGPLVLYTTAKGFIANPANVLDLALACASSTQQALVQWLSNAIQILPDSPPRPLASFVSQSCAAVSSGAVSKAYWLVPTLPPSIGRADLTPIQVLAEFN